MKVAILGGTRGMGRALARELAQSGASVAILGRGEEPEKSAADLRSRFPKAPAAAGIACDLSAPRQFEQALSQASDILGGLDAVVVTAAEFASQADLEADAARLERLLTLNFTNTILFCEAARKRLLSTGEGSLVVFSSVAGDRGRKPVLLYGASKAGLSYYCEGLDHKFRSQGLNTLCVKPGFVKTAMTAGLKAPPFAGEPEAVAREVARAMRRGQPVLYTPSMWRWVMLLIRWLPRGAMRKIGF